MFNTYYGSYEINISLLFKRIKLLEINDSFWNLKELTRQELEKIAFSPYGLLRLECTYTTIEQILTSIKYLT